MIRPKGEKQFKVRHSRFYVRIPAAAVGGQHQGDNLAGMYVFQSVEKGPS